ncbi:MAG: Alpha/beta hydrolase fold protein [Frankiales bacterium]|nr:Alpha/beta hydrolase fold protein [Frankiales bacterium]
MAFTTVDDGTRLYWEESGSGTPLLLIQGLGWSAEMWYSLVPQLETSHRVIRYDGRGIGRSEVPPGPYSIELMADDAVAVLRAAGLDRAHVLGVSLGGIVAQEVALRHPDAVSSLILGCTHPGGAETVWPDPEVMEVLKSRTAMPFDEAVKAAVKYAYSQSCDPAVIERDMKLRLELPTSPEGYSGQLLGGLGYQGTHPRQKGLAVPALVFTGDADQMVPPENSATLADAIPDSTTVLISGAGHVVFTERPAEVAAAVRDFLDRVDL